MGASCNPLSVSLPAPGDYHGPTAPHASFQRRVSWARTRSRCSIIATSGGISFQKQRPHGVMSSVTAKTTYSERFPGQRQSWSFLSLCPTSAGCTEGRSWRFAGGTSILTSKFSPYVRHGRAEGRSIRRSGTTCGWCRFLQERSITPLTFVL